MCKWTLVIGLILVTNFCLAGCGAKPDDPPRQTTTSQDKRWLDENVEWIVDDDSDSTTKPAATPDQP